MSFTDWLKHSFGAFTNNKDPTSYSSLPAYGSSFRPDRNRLSFGNDKTIAASIQTRIAVDVSEIIFKHVRLDENERYLEDIDSGLNEILNVEANLDQSGTAFIRDIVLTMLDDGVACVVPSIKMDTYSIPKNGYDIETARVGTVKRWFPEHVLVEIYSQRTGKKEQIMCHKRKVAIIENPFYTIMNEPNSIGQRLMRKLNLMDRIDEMTASGKLDLIVQLPYTVKSLTRKKEIEERRKEIEFQLTGSKYGIAYMDAAEKIVQLNRPLENNLLDQIDFLTNMFYSQMGISEAILTGVAREEEMLNYVNHIIVPITTAITDEFVRKFLSKKARTQGQSVTVFIEPFKLVAPARIAELADKLARNEVLSSNEIRALIGFKPSSDPKADMLLNSNNIVPDLSGLPQYYPDGTYGQAPPDEMEDVPPDDLNQNGS